MSLKIGVIAFNCNLDIQFTKCNLYSWIFTQCLFENTFPLLLDHVHKAILSFIINNQLATQKAIMIQYFLSEGIVVRIYYGSMSYY